MAQVHSSRSFVPQIGAQYASFPFFVASMALMLLTLIALLVFIVRFRVTGQLNRASGNEALPLKALGGSILSFVAFAVLDVISGFCVYFHPAALTAATVVSVFHLAAQHLAYTSLFLVFYQLVQRYLARLAPGGNISTWQRTHLGCLVTLSLLSIVDFGIWIAYSVRVAMDSSDPTAALSYLYAIFTVVRVILFFLASLEISYWVIVITFPRFFSYPFQTNTGTRPLLIGVLSFLILNVFLATLSIKYYLFSGSTLLFVSTVQSGFAFVCIIGIYTGLLKCCTQWLQNGLDYMPVAPEGKAYPGTYLYQARIQLIAQGWRI